MTEVPFQISFTDTEPSEAVSFLLREKFDKLSEQFDRIISCHIFISRPSHRTRQKIYNVRIHLVIPGREFEASREASDDDVNGDIRLAIDWAFSHITREVRDYVVRRREQARHVPRAEPIPPPMEPDVALLELVQGE
jgi:ribosome-associated translation inhibitor RaiA